MKLDGADPFKAYLANANLDGTYLRRSNIGLAYIGSAILTNTDLRGAVLTHRFAEAVLGGADLRGSKDERQDG